MAGVEYLQVRPQREVNRKVREGPWVSKGLVGHCKVLDFPLIELGSWGVFGAQSWHDVIDILTPLSRID